MLFIDTVPINIGLNYSVISLIRLKPVSRLEVASISSHRFLKS